MNGSCKSLGLRPFGTLCRVFKTHFSSSPRVTQQPFFKLKISSEVRHAIDNSLPIVALESTIISHGMPYPQNKQVAMEVEEIVRSHQCTPATIAIIDGECCIGLDESQLERIADPNTKTLKASKRDIAYVCAHRLDAATTVASTMVLAHLAGIRVFCTGGIGGVHRGAEYTFDVSADLEELARTPVAVVCAGIKSILDIPKSLEVLETKGVPVVTYQSDTFPSFFTNDSGVSSPMVAQNEKSVAEMMYLSSQCNFSNGMVVAVPNPAPADSEKINSAIDKALRDADVDRIDGARLTPYILAAIEKSTEGRSLFANIALVKNNAKVASNIAKELSAMQDSKASSKNSEENKSHSKGNGVVESMKDDILWGIEKNARNKNDILVFGGAVIDNVATSTQHIILGSSNPGNLISTVGGVGRNIATALAKLGDEYKIGMVTCVGRDEAGAKVLRNLSSNNVDVSRTMIKKSIPTATYNAIHEGISGSLTAAVADMHIFDEINALYVDSLREDVKKARLVITDGNLSIDAFRALGELCNRYDIPLYFEPTSDYKCLLPLLVEPQSSSLSSWSNGIQLVNLLKPNLSELIALVNYIVHDRNLMSEISNDVSYVQKIQSVLSRENPETLLTIEEVKELSILLYKAMCPSGEKFPIEHIMNKKVIVSLGNRGCLLVATNHRNLKIAHYPVPDDCFVKTVVNTSGAGDCLFAGIVNQIVSQQHIEKVIECGFNASKQSLMSSSAVPDKFNVT